MLVATLSRCVFERAIEARVGCDQQHLFCWLQHMVTPPKGQERRKGVGPLRSYVAMEVTILLHSPSTNASNASTLVAMDRWGCLIRNV